MSESIDFKIECYTKFSWGYVYWNQDSRQEIWADSAEALKRKVLSRNLPWDDTMVPKAKGVNIQYGNLNYSDADGSPVRFRLPWCESNYKRY